MDIFKSRRSIRNYQTKMIKENELAVLLQVVEIIKPHTVL